MSWLDKLKITTKEIGKVAKLASEDLTSNLENKFGSEEWYKSTKHKTEKVRDITKTSFNTSAKVAKGIVNDISKTKDGKEVGNTTRKVTSSLSKLPLFTLTSDVIKARHGVNQLYDHLKENPEDPIRHIWLAEAMKRVRYDRKVYTTFRTVTDPTYILIRKGIQTISSLGEEPLDPVEIRLLKNAYYLSKRQINIDPKNPLSYETLSRVYLAVEKPLSSIECAKISLMLDPEYSNAFVTLSRGYLAISQVENAHIAALKAVDNGNTYGNKILADVVLLKEYSDISTKIREYERFCESIVQSDRELYLGPSVTGLNLIEGVGKEQWDKLLSIKRRMEE